MQHIQHIHTCKKFLDLRFDIVKQIRFFFWSKNFQEVDAPHIVHLPGQEPYLSPMSLNIHDEAGNAYHGFLHTSPEYTMKKMLAAGYERIFSLGTCYRDWESFGGTHNPEFSMLEWYRTGVDFYKIMEDTENLVAHIFKNIEWKNPKFNIQEAWQRKTMQEIWKEYADIDLDDHLTNEAMFELNGTRGYKPSEDESYEDLFYRFFLNEIEPKLKEQNLIIHHYPAQMASLAKLSDDDPRYAERFEAYIDGVELANAFTELTDADEQKRRLENEQRQRQELGKGIFDIDKEFLDAVQNLPPCAGIALGVDRLVQALVGCQNIDDVLVLPASKLFKTE